MRYDAHFTYRQGPPAAFLSISIIEGQRGMRAHTHTQRTRIAALQGSEERHAHAKHSERPTCAAHTYSYSRIL